MYAGQQSCRTPEGRRRVGNVVLTAPAWRARLIYYMCFFQHSHIPNNTDMPPLLLPLPTTALLTFSNVLHDPSIMYTSQLAEATAARTTLQLALKAVAANEAGSSALAVVDVSRLFLPPPLTIDTGIQGYTSLPTLPPRNHHLPRRRRAAV
jgi:hypothetical protein